MSDIFINTEIQRPPKQHPNNCPPGHLVSIAHGGHGHWDGDGSCNSSPTASISFIISFIIPFLFITAILMIAFVTKNLKVYYYCF